MLLKIILYYKAIKPRLLGILFRFFYSSQRIIVGKNFQCDSFPSIQVDKGCQIVFGDNVQLRRNVEIRAHNFSQIQISCNIRIDRGVRLLATNNSIIMISDGVRIGLYSVFNGGDNITIGQKVLISGFVYLQTSMHNYKKGINVQEQGYSHKPIIIEDDVWIGAHAVILPGCTLGKGIVVGSNAVVTRSYAENTVLGGVPASVIKDRE